MKTLFAALLVLALAACATRGKVEPPPAASTAEVTPAPEPDAAGGGVPSERKPSNKSCTDAYEHVAAMTCPPLDGRAWITGKCATLESTLVTKIKNAKNCHDARETGAF